MCEKSLSTIPNFSEEAFQMIITALKSNQQLLTLKEKNRVDLRQKIAQTYPSYKKNYSITIQKMNIKIQKRRINRKIDPSEKIERCAQ
jgi:hypothetical protein